MEVREQEKSAILACRAPDEALLTPREEQIVTLLMAGICTNKSIATALFLSEGTIKAYLSRLYARIRACGFRIDTKSELVAWAYARERGDLENFRRVRSGVQHPATALNRAAP